MKNFLFLPILLLLSIPIKAQENYLLSVEGQTVEISEGQAKVLSVNGKEIEVLLRTKDTLLYKDEKYSFRYPKDFKVIRTQQHEFEQVMVLSATGTGFLIQKYYTIDPGMLGDLLLEESTKESKTYGYHETREDYQRSLSSGQKVQVRKSVLDYKMDRNIYEVATFSGKDEGLVILTINMVIEGVDTSEGERLLRLFWDSLSIE